MNDTLTFVDAPAFFGEVSTNGDAWATDERPKSFRQKILELWPNGHVPLTGLTSLMGNEAVTDPEFSWYERDLPLQGGACTIYSDIGLSSAIGATAVAVDGLVYVKVAEAVADHFREGHQVLLSTDYRPDLDRNGKIVAVHKAGASSRLTVKMWEAVAASDLANATYIGVVGNINPEGSNIPDVIGYKPVKRYSYTQIFRNPFELTRTARLTKLRTEDPYVRLRRENLLLHGLDIERALIWGERRETTGANSEPERSTRGIIKWISDVAPQNMVNFYNSTDTAFDGKAWASEAGIEFTERYLEHLFQFGSQEKMCLCGSGFLRGMNKLARTIGQINISSGATSFGIKVTRWETPHGVVYFKVHPLFNRRETYRWSGLFIEPQFLKIRIVTDTKLKNDKGEDEAGTIAFDGKKEEYLAELGLELHHAKAFALWSGVGLDHENYAP